MFEVLQKREAYDYVLLDPQHFDSVNLPLVNLTRLCWSPWTLLRRKQRALDIFDRLTCAKDTLLLTAGTLHDRQVEKFLGEPVVGFIPAHQTAVTRQSRLIAVGTHVEDCGEIRRIAHTIGKGGGIANPLLNHARFWNSFAKRQPAPPQLQTSGESQQYGGSPRLKSSWHFVKINQRHWNTGYTGPDGIGPNSFRK